MAVGLNIIGLSVAFTAFLVIMMQVSHDHSFDRCHPKAGRIFLAELCDSVMANGRVIYPGAFSDVLIASSPHIEAGTMITPYDKRNYLSVGEGSDAEGFREKVTTLPSCNRGYIRILICRRGQGLPFRSRKSDYPGEHGTPNVR